MCDKCRQLEIDIKRYQKLLRLGLDPQTISIRRSRKLLAVGMDPLTIGRIDRVIQQLAPANYLGTEQVKPPASAHTAITPRLKLWTRR